MTRFVPLVPLVPPFREKQSLTRMRTHARACARMCVCVCISRNGTTEQKGARPCHRAEFDPFRFLFHPRNGRNTAEQGCETGSDVPRCALVCYGCSTAALQMATSASQTYIARLGFQDRDRSNERHGLACEYLFERILELEVAPLLLKNDRSDITHSISDIKRKIAEYEQSPYHGHKAHLQQAIATLQELQQELNAFDANLNPDKYILKAHDCHKVGKCVNVPIMSRSFVNGFADVLIDIGGYYVNHKLLGEVKITKEPAENVLQQVNFYLSYLGNVESVYIVTDYDPGDLKRLCAGTKIKVYRLGQVFEEWLTNRTTPDTQEL